MTPEMWVGLAFVTAIAVASLTSMPPIILACILPLILAGGKFAYILAFSHLDYDTSAAVVSALVWSGFGSLIGAFVGHWLGSNSVGTRPPPADYRKQRKAAANAQPEE